MSNGSYERVFSKKIAFFISLIIAVIIILHQIYPLNVDSITIILFVIIMVVWLPNLDSMELPGGIKLNFTRKVKDAVNNINTVIGSDEPEINEKKDYPLYKQIFEIDPNLTMVYFRIEIEVRIRELAEKYGIKLKPRAGLNSTLKEVSKKNDTIKEISGSLNELIYLGNQAAHGINVPKEAGNFILKDGPKILALLDEILKSE